MGDIFILIFKRITIFNSILMIIHCLFHPDLGEFEYMFIVIILLLISWIAWLTGKMLNFLSRNKGLKEKKTETNNIVKSFCLKFSRDIDVIYAIFFAVFYYPYPISRPSRELISYFLIFSTYFFIKHSRHIHPPFVLDYNHNLYSQFLLNVFLYFLQHILHGF